MTDGEYQAQRGFFQTAHAYDDDLMGPCHFDIIQEMQNAALQGGGAGGWPVKIRGHGIIVEQSVPRFQFASGLDDACMPEGTCALSGHACAPHMVCQGAHGFIIVRVCQIDDGAIHHEHSVRWGGLRQVEQDFLSRADEHASGPGAMESPLVRPVGRENPVALLQKTLEPCALSL